MTVQDELDRLGKDIIDDAKKNASKNKKTGKLEKSLTYNTTITNDDNFTLVLEEVYYGQFLNDKNGFMDKAISKNLGDGINNIVDTMIDEILEEI